MHPSISYLHTSDTAYRVNGKRKKYKLAMCWTNMKGRAKIRTGCEVCDDWKTYAGFRLWAIANGYKEGLTLCRTGDVGNYEPSNVRWDTQANNTIEGHARHYKLLFKGELVEVYNLNQFSKDNNLNSSHMSKVMSGKLTQHRGYSKFVEKKP